MRLCVTRSNDDHNYAKDNLSDALSITLMQVPVESAQKVARQVSVSWDLSVLLKVSDYIELEIFEVLYSNVLKTIEVVNNDVLKVCKPVAQEVCANVEVAVPR